MAEPVNAGQNNSYIVCFQKQPITISDNVDDKSTQIVKEIERGIAFTPNQYFTVDRNVAFNQAWESMIPGISFQERKPVLWTYKENPIYCDVDPDKALEALKNGQATSSFDYVNFLHELNMDVFAQWCRE